MGVVRGEGTFEAGDAVGVVDSAGREIARGLSNYAAAEVPRIAGRRTADLRQLDPPASYDEVIHRDNLVLC